MDRMEYSGSCSWILYLFVFKLGQWFSQSLKMYMCFNYKSHTDFVTITALRPLSFLTLLLQANFMIAHIIHNIIDQHYEAGV